MSCRAEQAGLRIERAGLRKHLPAWKAKHLSDPFSHQVVSLFTAPPHYSLPSFETLRSAIGCHGATPSSSRPYSLITRGLACSSHFQVSREEKKQKGKKSRLDLSPQASPSAPPLPGGTNKATLTSTFLFLLVPKLGLGGNKWAHQLA